MVSINGKRIVLIGGAGFIGHNLAIGLKNSGAEVSVVDGLQVNNLLSFMSNNGSALNSDLYVSIIHQRLELLRKHNIPLHVQDARDYYALSNIMTKTRPEIVIHLAAVAHADRSNKDPYSTFDHSLRTLENALDSCRDRVDHFIYFSSSMVYGNFRDGMVSEDSPCEPLGIYGALKFAGEKMVIAYNQVFDLSYTIIRPSALYGERCVSGRVGQMFIENAIEGLDISIHGDGSDRLDFTYISDLVNGVKQIVESEQSRNEIFNITYGQSRSIAEMADILHAHFPEVKINYLPKNKLMPSRGTLSVEKARKIIGYRPEYPLDRGFVNYIKWYRQLYKLSSEIEQVRIEENVRDEWSVNPIESGKNTLVKSEEII